MHKDVIREHNIVTYVQFEFMKFHTEKLQDNSVRFVLIKLKITEIDTDDILPYFKISDCKTSKIKFFVLDDLELK